MRNGISSSSFIILAIAVLSVGPAVAGGKGGGGGGGHLNVGGGIQGESKEGSRQGNIEILSRSRLTGKPVHKAWAGVERDKVNGSGTQTNTKRITNIRVNANGVTSGGPLPANAVAGRTSTQTHGHVQHTPFSVYKRTDMSSPY
jgi:hypothetical protein